jgi:hypothetical protein
MNSILMLMLMHLLFATQSCKKRGDDTPTTNTSLTRQGALAIGSNESKNKAKDKLTLVQTEKNISTLRANDLNPTPKVAMGDNGSVVISWVQNLSDDIFAVFKSTYHEGTWSHPAQRSDHFPLVGPAGKPQLAMDKSGNAIAVWQQSDGKNLRIYKAEYREGSWHSPATADQAISPAGSDASLPAVALGAQGNAIIVWEQRDDKGYAQIFKSEYRSATWIHPRSLSDNISPDEQNAYNAQVAMDSSGNAVVVWSQGVGESTEIFKSEFRNGAWVHPATISDFISPKG